MAALADLSDEPECTVRPDDGTAAMTVRFIVEGDTIVFPMDRPEIRAWYEERVRHGAREVTVEIGDETFRGKALVVPWPGVYEYRQAFVEKYRELAPEERTLDVPAVAVDFDPWW